MHYKLKYSSLLYLQKKKSILYIKGPLGKNYLKVPNEIKFHLDSCNKFIIFSFRKLKNKKKSNLRGFLSIFLNICRTVVFGDFIGLNIQGLGLKFLKINNVALQQKSLLMNLGYSDPVNFSFSPKQSKFFFKDIRNICIFSIDYSHLRNQTFTLLSFKKPNKFRKRDNGITLQNFIS
jgi:ribosomal protein L6P/L9E